MNTSSQFGPKKMVEKVKVTSLEAVKDVHVSDWPSGSFLGNVINSLRTQEVEWGENSIDANKIAPYWQACARWALLYKFGFTTLHPAYHVISNNTGESSNVRHVLQMSDADIARIRTEWESVLLLEKTPEQSSELSQLLTTSLSNGKELQWAVMECQAGCQFRLHSHPNLELVYCVTGSLFEIRHNNEGWSFGTLNAGQWLVNEIDSIHKSFTATNGHGCTLLVLWSGAHANLDEIPFVQDAVNNVDQKLNECKSCGDWDEIKETFLPDSEKCLR